MNQTFRAIQTLIVSLIVILVALSLGAPVMESVSENGEPDGVPFVGVTEAVHDLLGGGLAWLESLPASVPALAGVGVLLVALVKWERARRGQPGGDHRVE